MTTELAYRLLVTLLFASEQQWGVVYIGSDSEKNISFNVSFSSICYGGFSTNAHTLHLSSDAGTSFYNITKSTAKISHTSNYAGNVFWLAIGKQQWGVDYGRATAKQINYPIAFSKFAKVVAVDGFYNSTRYSKSVLYGEPVLSHFKFTYDTETDFVNWIAIGVQQWGVYTTGTRNVTITLPIATSVTYVVIAVARTENNYGCSGSQNCQYVSHVTNKTFQAGSYDKGNGYAGFWWVAIGKA